MIYHLVKRTIDVSLATVAIVALAPFLAAIALVVRLTSRGPALFKQERVGLGQRPFTVYKFRSMVADNDENEHRRYVTALLTCEEPPDGGEPGVFKIVSDPRVTKVGRFLRRTSLDELPQLFNVLRGDMSLVGPRPALPWEVELYEERHLRRFQVLPGVTGLWQVSGRSHIGMRDALELDLNYVEERSLALDVRILIRTIPSVLVDVNGH